MLPFVWLIEMMNFFGMVPGRRIYSSIWLYKVMRGPSTTGPPLVVEEDLETILFDEGKVVGLVDSGKQPAYLG
jgi:hypothetical protein